MEIDKNLVKQYRVDRNWTQQHLADACGISLRTVQRIEKLGNASSESIMSLCAVFEITKQDIAIVPELKAQPKQTITLWPYYLAIVGALALGLIIGSSASYWLIHLSAS
jgi:DNA-binding XRE family transcriptional regulator